MGFCAHVFAPMSLTGAAVDSGVPGGLFTEQSDETQSGETGSGWGHRRSGRCLFLLCCFVPAVGGLCVSVLASRFQVCVSVCLSVRN